MATTLDPAKKGVGIDLVDGNLAVRSQLLNWGTVSWAFATAAIPAGARQYAEFKADNVGTRQLMIGVGDGTDLSGPLTVGVSYRNDRAYWVDNVYKGDLATWVTGSVLMMAVDAGAAKVWFGVDGVWANGDPAAGTGGISRATAGLFFGCGAFVHATEGPHKITARFAAGAQTYAPPTGFTAVDGGGAPATITGTLAATEGGADTVSITGAVAVSGTLAAAESGADAAAIVGTVRVSGQLGAAETGADTASLTGSVPIAGTLSAAEIGSDAAAMAGEVPVTGALVAQESGADTADLSGGFLISGTLSATETGSDTASFHGSEPDTITGTLAASEVGADTASLTGRVTVQGALAANESGSDSASMTGSAPIGGRLTAVEAANDNAAMTGRVLVSGSLVAIETGSDTAQFRSGQLTVRADRLLPGRDRGRLLPGRDRGRILAGRARHRIIGG